MNRTRLVMSSYYRKETLMQRDRSPLIALRRNNNAVKKNLYRYVGEGSNVLEIAGGRGGDLFKLYQRKPYIVMFTDIDPDGIEEAVSRYGKLSHPFFMIAKQADFTKDQTKLIRDQGVRYDIVSIQFAIHYFVHDFESIFRNIDVCLRPGGHVLITMMEVGDVEDFACDGFAMKKLTNHTVSIWFDTFDTPQTEYIVDHKELLAKFKNKGYDIIESDPFPIHRSLSANEKRITRMYRYMVLRKQIPS